MRAPRTLLLLIPSSPKSGTMSQAPGLEGGTCYLGGLSSRDSCSPYREREVLTLRAVVEVNHAR